MAATGAVGLAARLQRWVRLPRWTVRLRLTLLYGALLLVSGAAALAITYWLVGRFLAGLSPLQALDLSLPSPPSDTYDGGASIVQFQTPTATGQYVVFTSQQLAALVAHQRSTELHQLLLRSGVTVGLMALIAVALGWFVVGRALRPLRAMAMSTRQISEDDLKQRVAPDGPRDELRELGETFDGLLGRLDAAFEAQRNFVANASHELRTPLTLACALLEMRLGDPDATAESFRSTCEDVLATARDQEKVIKALLTLARSQRGLKELGPLDLAHTVSRVVRANEGEAAQRGVSLTASLASAQVLGDESLCERLVSKLVDNAVRYNIAGGRVAVAVKPLEAGTALTVANTGPVVPPGDVERLLQPFQRLSKGRGAEQEGQGLGLSIVAAITKAHGATLDLKPKPDGGLGSLSRRSRHR